MLYFSLRHAEADHGSRHSPLRAEIGACLAFLASDKSMTKKNRESILAYIKFRNAQGLSIPRQVRYIFSLRKLARLLEGKNFIEATRENLVNVVSSIESEDTHYDTKRTEKECIKCFYRWLRGGDEGDEYPSEVKWIKSKRTRNHSILPENLVTEDEVKIMAESCPNPRDPALILLIYETGGRIGEVLSLTVGAVSFDKYGAVLTVAGKTGGRRVRIIFSAMALANWMNHHPARNDPEAPLWTSFESVGSPRRLEYFACRKMLNEDAHRCRINKRVNPHSFRHARASTLANVLTEAQMNEYLGWIPGSRMPAVYVHLTRRNVDNALFKLNGIRDSRNHECVNFWCCSFKDLDAGFSINRENFSSFINVIRLTRKVFPRGTTRYFLLPSWSELLRNPFLSSNLSGVLTRLCSIRRHAATSIVLRGPLSFRT